MSILEISNDGQKIASTNYWQSEHAKAGLFYLSGNAGAYRLLVPAVHVGMMAEMRTGRGVTIEPSIVTAGHLDVVFEDGTDSPFCLTLDRRQCDRSMEKGRKIPFLVYTEDGEQLRLEASVR